MSEIGYAIHPSLTLEQGCLVIELLEIIREAIPTSPSEERSVAKWNALTKTSADKDAFAFLIKEELLFQQRVKGRSPHSDSFTLNQIHISPSQALVAFEKLIPTQKLFCQGKQLVIDLYGKAHFYYQATLLENGKLEITGRIRWRDKDISLHECSAVGPGKPYHWFVYNLSLKILEPSFAWKKLHDLRLAPLLLEGGL